MAQVSKHRPPQLADAARLEAQIVSLAHRARIGPRLLATAEDEHGVTLRLARIGRPWPRRPSRELIAALARAVAIFHRLRPPAALRNDPGRWLEPSAILYVRAAQACLAASMRRGRFSVAERRVLTAWRQGLTALMAHARGYEPVCRRGRLRLCHGDLWRGNLRVEGGRVVLLDFESARWADPAWDLAQAALALRLTAAAEDRLLEAYGLVARGDPELVTRFFAYRSIGVVFHPLDLLARSVGANAPGRFPGRAGPLLTAFDCERGAMVLSQLAGRELGSLAPLLAARARGPVRQRPGAVT